MASPLYLPTAAEPSALQKKLTAPVQGLTFNLPGYSQPSAQPSPVGLPRVGAGSLDSARAASVQAPTVAKPVTASPWVAPVNKQPVVKTASVDPNAAALKQLLAEQESMRATGFATPSQVPTGTFTANPSLPSNFGSNAQGQINLLPDKTFTAPSTGTENYYQYKPETPTPVLPAPTSGTGPTLGANGMWDQATVAKMISDAVKMNKPSGIASVAGTTTTGGTDFNSQFANLQSQADVTPYEKALLAAAASAEERAGVMQNIINSRFDQQKTLTEQLNKARLQGTQALGVNLAGGANMASTGNDMVNTEATSGAARLATIEQQRADALQQLQLDQYNQSLQNAKDLTTAQQARDANIISKMQAAQSFAKNQQELATGNDVKLSDGTIIRPDANGNYTAVYTAPSGATKTETLSPGQTLVDSAGKVLFTAPAKDSTAGYKYIPATKYQQAGYFNEATGDFKPIAGSSVGTVGGTGSSTGSINGSLPKGAAAAAKIEVDRMNEALLKGGQGSYNAVGTPQLWGAAFDSMKAQFPTLSNEQIDSLLQKGTYDPAGPVMVKDKKTGEPGYIPLNEFDPKLYERI